MKKKFKLGIIGCGFMATAIAKGAVLSDFLSPKKLILSDIDEKKLDSVEELGVYTCDSNKFVAENSEYLLLAVRFANFGDVVKSLAGVVPEKIISVIYGLDKIKIKKAFGDSAAKVARCAPDFPCSIGSGIIGVDMSDFNESPDDTEFISKVFDCLGTVLSVDEYKMDAVTGLNGCAPIHAFMLIDALTDAGVRQGLTHAEAKALAVQSVLGAAEMAKREEQPVSELLVKACNNGGNFAESVAVLEDGNFGGLIEKSVGACVSRFKKLSEQ